ncbi:flavin reductase family protein [Brevibacillus sp. M2.1A]|uniref:flavin reductase family protein n=1 Tax=Brevibacillus TaxID=55080 RepID=UPI00156AC755|nr:MULTISPECIES: flavin reductase family protein [Brevibacillus]MCC8436772.1 flavin reductase family protein [Brevibacillus sp. M2.1A]MCE0448763.1 flavin reductase family protein [Brevibacillus sp. AF8]UKK98947.1 flavin reductase family protein [Brevibacillus brevis]
MHKVVEPKILYFGTPVVLISTLNEDNSVNLAPMSSAWWLNQSCMLGMSSSSQTVANLLRERECVLNLPSSDLAHAVDRLALLTGRNPVPERKANVGYQFEPDKFGTARLTPQDSDLIRPPRVAECPVQLEARLEQVHNFELPSSLKAIEVKIVRVHIDEQILMTGEKNYIDPEKWSPLIMNFCEFFGLSTKLHPSRLAPVFGPSPSSVSKSN